MTEAELAVETPDEVTLGAGRSPLGLALQRLLRKRIAVIALAFIAVFYFCGLFAPVVAPRSYTAQDLDNVLQGPSLAHPLGTDRLGRDMLSRVIWASRTTVIVTLATLVTDSKAMRPMPGMPRRVSVKKAPSRRVTREMPMMVVMGRRALRATCRLTTVNSCRPLARAVRT